MKPRLTMVTLGVSDFNRSVEFYRDGLGWKNGKFLEDVAFIQLSGVLLGLYPREKLAEDATVPSEGGGFTGFSLAHNVESEVEVDEVLRTVEKLGAKIVKPGQKVFWGGYCGYFADPDGFLWEVAHNPFWTYDERGVVVL